MSKLLFITGAMSLSGLGIAHGLLTLRDLRAPRAFVPTDEQVRRTMAGAALRLAPQTTVWKAWIGFNLSHSLGLVGFGALLTELAFRDFELVTRSAFLQVVPAVVAALYLLLAVRYWFWAPAAVFAVGVLCFVASALSG